VAAWRLAEEIRTHCQQLVADDRPAGISCIEGVSKIAYVTATFSRLQ
jgi:hypothetical protein